MKLNIKIRDLAFRPILFLWFFIHLSSLNANVAVTNTITGGITDIPTYFNGDNTLTISIVLNNTSTAHLTNYASGTIIPYIVWAENGSSAPAFDGDLGNAYQWNDYISNISAGGTCTISIPASAFLNTGNNSPQNDWFDLKLLMSKGGQSDVQLDINFGSPHNRNYLTFDTDDPAFTTKSGSFLSNDYFNATISLSLQPDENLYSADATYKSYIKLTGRDDSPVDAGGVHYYYLSGGALSTGSNTSVSNPTFYLENGSTEAALVDGAEYDVDSYIYDVAGNLSHAINVDDQTYDATNPTIRKIITTLGASSVTKKKDDNINVRVYFSEDVTADGAVTVTLETQGNSGTDGTAVISAWPNSNNATNIKDGTYTVGADDASSDLTVNAIAAGSNITDLAGNNMSSFSIPADSNLANYAAIVVDGVMPYLTKMTADPNSGALSLDETTTITAEFNEIVTLTGTVDFVLSSNAATTLQISSVADGLDANSNPVSQGSVVYTVIDGDLEAADLSISSIAFSAGGKIVDAAGNEVTSISQPGDQELRDNADLTVETVAPVIGSITTTYATGVYGEGAEIPVTLNFLNGAAGSAEDVALTGTGTINIGVGGVANGGTATFSAASDATVTGTYTVGASDTEGNISAESVALVGAGTLTDVAGNTAVLTMPSSIFSGKTITIDRTKPFLNTITTNDYSTSDTPTLKIGDQLDILLNFDNTVKLNAGNIIVTFNTTNTAGTATVSPASGDQTLTATYTVSEGESATRLDISSVALDPDDGDVTLTDNPTYAADNTTFKPNNIDEANGFTPVTDFVTGGWNIAVDGVYPFISNMTSDTDDGTYGIGDVISVTVNFNEEVTSNNTLELPFGLTSNISFAAITTAATSVTGTYTVVANDNVAALDVTGAAVNNGTIIDAASNPLQTAGLTLPASSNLTDVPKAIVIDGVRPAAPSISSVAPAGGSATLSNASDYTSYYNSTNTGVNITVDFDDANDASMENGKIRIEGRVGTSNSWQILKANYAVQSGDWGSANKEAIINVVADTVESLTDYAHGGTIYFRAYNIDVASNISSSASSASSGTTIDLQVPSLVSITSSTNDGNYKEGEDIVIIANFNDGDGDTDADDQVSLVESATLDLTMNVGSGAQSITSISSSATGTVTYTIGSGADHYNPSKVALVSAALSSADKLRDNAGNIVGTAGETAINIVSITNMDAAHNIYADGLSPDAPTVTSVTTDVVPVANYWNEENANAVFLTTLANDASMIDGKVYVFARTGANNYAQVGDAHDPVTSDESSGASSISITLTAVQLATITGWPTASAAVGDVDFKIRSEDKAGNTTDTEDANKVTIHVDELDPNAGTISGLETDVTTATHSIAVQGYWNISTDYLKVSLGDISAKDDNIVGGNVLLYGNINNFGWDTLGTAANISDGNKADFFVEVSEFGDWGGDQVDGVAPYGVKELEMNGNAWADMDQYDISIKAAVTDAAGNITEYLHTNTFATTGNSTIFIDGINSTDRPTISSATADKADGWWGPSSDGLPIQIQLETSVAITVDVTAGTPSISLQTGSVTGSAAYSGVSGTTLSFAYTPTTGETSQGNSTSGIVDGRLEFKLDNNGEAVITLNNGIMHEASGNLLAAATLSTNAILPAPDTQSSLDGNKNIIIDGVAPYRVQNTVVDMAIQNINPDDQDEYWTERTGYYNANTDRMLFYIYYRYTSDDANIDDLGSRVDMSLQTNDPSLDCNTATGTDCGTIQLKAEAVPSGSPIAYLDLGSAHSMTYSTLTNGENYPYEQIIIDATDFESYNAVKHNAQFSDGLTMTFKAVITDLAGNQLETAVYGTPIIVDQTPPAQGTTGAVVTNADNTANIVAGYWNSHNTGIQITAPLPDDATLEGGAVHILGKVTGAADFSYLGNYYVWDGNYDASYNISSTELAALESTVPSPTTFLADTIDPYSGIEEILDYAEGVELTFAARVFDVAGNYTDWLPSATTITVDETVPTVTEVTSLNPNRAYTVDDVVTISVVASENITSVGTGADNSTLELAVGGGTGGANPTAPFRSASNDTVYYAHTVSAGESSEDASPLITTADNLNYAATNSLVINANGGALIDPAGNNLNTLLPTTPGDFALAQKKSIIIDSDDFGVTFNYFETTTAVTDSSDSLVSVNDINLIIQGTFTDSVQIDSIPTLAIDFPPAGASTGDITSAAMTRIGIWKYEYNLTLIDSVDGNLIITPTAYDKAANLINQNSVVANGITRMDNLEPEFTLLSPDSNSYVNNRQVSYQLSEDVRTGKITWTRASGNPDPNSPHEVELVSAELLDDVPYENITLTNDPVNLVDGTYYNIAWSAVDSADNPSVVDKFVSSPVLYDITGPNVQLTYSQYVAGEGYIDTITATFNEKIWPAPQIAIDYQGQFNDVSPAEIMTIDAVSGGDSTVWLYEAVLPGGEENNGTTYVAIEATDLAGNLLLATNIFDGDTLIVDNSAPACTLTYVNVNKPWLTNEGKGQDQIQVVARMSEKFDPFPFPQLNIEYSDSTSDSFVNLEGGISSSGDSIFTWTITLPDSIKNSGNMNISLNAKDRAQNLINRYVGETDFIVDNTPPDTFNTGTAASYGLNPKANWINGITDSVGVLVPIPAISSDPTLFYNSKGGLDIEFWNKTRGVGWVNIPNSQEPFADSIQLGGQNSNFYRTMTEIEAIMVPEVDLVQGDSIYVRVAISDRAGNKTYGDTSTTVFVYDPYPPTVANINGGNVLTLDTLKSQDNLTATWTGSSDSTYNSIPGSGILNYDYKIHMHDSLGVYMDTLIDWTSTGLIEEMSRNDLGLRHNRMYSVNIRAVDVAGNVSASVISDTLYRLSSAPVITTIDSTIIWEDSLYTDTVQLTDLDLSTVLGDTFSYVISWENSLLPPSGNAIEIADTNGVVRWTPTATDTGKFQLKVLVTDMWGLKDSLVYPLTIKPVNDRPVFSQLLPDTFFVEDQTDTFKINLTHYISDEDNNDSTDITWSAVIKDTTNRPGYPRMSLFFGPGTPEYMKDYLRQKYIPKKRSRVSKTDFFQDELQSSNSLLNKSMANKINIQFFQDNALRTFAYFKTDSNYYGADHNIKFIALDKKLFNNNVLHTGLIGEDSLLLTINATNDRPKWTTIPIQSMYENDTMRFDPGAYVIDVDDTSLTFNLSVTTNTEKMSVTPAEYSSHNLGDSVVFIPEKLWSDFAVIQAIAKDAFNARDTVLFTVDVIRVPRPHITINVVQNNIFTNYYDILVTDTISKARNLSLEVQNESVVLDTIGRHTFRGHHKFISPGTYSIEVFADALVGDTTVFRSVGLALARTLGRWSGASSDGRFHVDGEAGAVNVDQSIMLVDSTMFKKGFVGSYKLGDEVQEFNDPVKVSLMSYQEDQAIYQRNHDNTWTELPSYYDQGRIVAYTEKMGYFRLGRKTLVVPGLTSLGQNYPNPFNPVTKITYDVGFVDGPEQHVNLSIYNLLGQHVQTLVDGQQTIGRHTVPWYGRDKTGMNVASGVYFMHMTTSVGKIQTKKVMLLR